MAKKLPDVSGRQNNTSIRESFAVSPNDLLQRPPFQDLYQIDPAVSARITEHMKANGYDNGQPITVWRHDLPGGDQERVVVDGNTRLQAAREAGLLMVTVVYRDFPSDTEALEYAIHNQRDRRNLTDAQILALVEMVDKPVTGFKEALPIARSQAIDGKPARSAELTAEVIGTGRSKVEEARTVLSDPVVKKEVRSGKLSIHAGAREVKAKQGRGKARAKPAGRVTISLPRGHAELVLRIIRRAKPATAMQTAAIQAIEKALK